MKKIEHLLWQAQEYDDDRQISNIAENLRQKLNSNFERRKRLTQMQYELNRLKTPKTAVLGQSNFKGMLICVGLGALAGLTKIEPQKTVSVIGDAVGVAHKVKALSPPQKTA